MNQLLKVQIDEEGYKQIEEHAKQSGLDINQYIKRALVLMMNIDDASMNKDSKIVVFDDNIEKLSITRSSINEVK